MKYKLFAASILTMITLGTMGYSYACWNGRIHINPCRCNCDVKFTKVTTYDNEIEKDVADITAQITCDRSTIDAYITNGYPCYEAYMDFTIKNTGNKPIHIDEVTIGDYDKTALEIEMTNIIACTWISPCETIDGSLTVHILQEAKQNWQYTFQVKIRTSCQPLRHPRTIGYWRAQFSFALWQVKYKSFLEPSTLEHYLDQITAQSDVFSFTGTRIQKFKQARNILKPRWRSNMEAKLRAHLLALWLNYVAEWTDGYEVEGKTVQDIILGSEIALIGGQTSEYEYWKNICDTFNNLW
jgi:hypothetical protein